MNIAELTLENRVTAFALALLLFAGGLASFFSMSRLEDPEYTIKEALVITPYPGASAIEVEEEVTDLLEIEIQKLGQLKEITSRSSRGLSIITAEIADTYDSDDMAQIWDELRRRVGDIQSKLPRGVVRSKVIDDYGDVYGVYVVVTGDGFSLAEVKEYVDVLKKELLLVDDVGRIETLGEQEEAVYVEFPRERIAALGIPARAIISEITERNRIVDSGRLNLGNDFVAIDPTGDFTEISEIENLLLNGKSGRQIRLGDIASVKRDFVDPPDTLVGFNGLKGIGLGVSTVSGGNAVRMGKGIKVKLAELQGQRPIGIEIGVVSLQSDTVESAISSFIKNLIEALIIVLVVLILFMGARSGLIVGAVLLLTIGTSFLFLEPMGVALERVSLGALILALGMLVDNAIVVLDSMSVRIGRGFSKWEAARDSVGQTQWPLLGSTLIAVLAFAAIGTSDDSTGEFCRSLFDVIFVTLLISWIMAITVTPLLGFLFLSSGTNKQVASGNQSRALRAYTSALHCCLKNRAICFASVAALLALGIVGFGQVDQSFFPPSTRAQFMVDVWLPKDTHIRTTHEEAVTLASAIRELPGVKSTSTISGRGALRFLLTYSPEKPDTSFAQIFVRTDDAKSLPKVIDATRELIRDGFDHIWAETHKFEIGPTGSGKVEARFSGDDPSVLRRLANQTIDVFREHPDSRAIRSNWREKTKVVEPVISINRANAAGITRGQIASALRRANEGLAIESFRDEILQLPIILREQQKSEYAIDALRSLQIWSAPAGKSIPMSQVAPTFRIAFEDPIIERHNRERSISVFSDPLTGYASELLKDVKPIVESIDLPPGYSLDWEGEVKATEDAQSALLKSLPAFLLAMLLITVSLFNSVRAPAIIWVCIPLSMVGVTAALLVSKQSFGFMSLIGFLSLVGMLVKNAIVLLDEVRLELENGKPLYMAIELAGISRFRPVALAAITTALGMIPLVTDDFFASMAVTIIGGLVVATFITLLFVPVLCTIFLRSKESHS